MNDRLPPLLRRAVPLLQEGGVGFALVGGLAVGIRAEPRFTRDLDFAVAVDSDDAAEQVARRFVTGGFHIRSELDNTRTGRLATLRLTERPDIESDEPVYLDLLFATCGIEPEVVSEAAPAQILPDLELPTARIPHLLAMKSVSAVNPHRLMDKQDMAWLAAEATPEELQRARELMDLITQRGYNPGHDLHALLDEAIELAELQRDQPY